MEMETTITIARKMQEIEDAMHEIRNIHIMQNMIYKYTRPTWNGSKLVRAILPAEQYDAIMEDTWRRQKELEDRIQKVMEYGTEVWDGPTIINHIGI